MPFDAQIEYFWLFSPGIYCLRVRIDIFLIPRPQSFVPLALNRLNLLIADDVNLLG